MLRCQKFYHYVTLLSLTVCLRYWDHLSCHVRKTVFRGNKQVRHKPGCTVKDGKKFEISDLRRRRRIVLCVAKTKMLISCTVTAQLICSFVFVQVKCWFPHVGDHLSCEPLHKKTNKMLGRKQRRRSVSR